MDAIYCLGCGVEIQTDQPTQLGYAPKSATEREEVICQRCFRLKHYNEVQDVDMKADDFINMLKEINVHDGLVIKIVDLFDVHGSFIPHLKQLVGKKPIVLIGNKVDLLPKSTNLNKVKLWLKEISEGYGLKVDDIFLVSSIKGIGMEDVSFELERLREGKDIFVVGCTNVGKSSFINYLINRSLKKKDVITTSYFPGTTLGFIDIPLDEQTSMIDTPGVINSHQIVHYLSKEDLKTVTPKKEVKPRVYQLHEKQTLYFGGLARVDIEQADEKKGYICYFANELMIHRTKLENADQLYTDHLGDLLIPPSEETLKNWPNLHKETFHINGDQKTDVVISGLGWVTVPSGNVKVTVHMPKGVKAVTRKAII
ncbi:ribosome biogenesis GTPase YqeH [Bacillaceae bacterium W0354]